MPRHTVNGGLVYRGFSASDLRSFLQRYQVGKRVYFPGFTSAAFHEEQAFGGNILFIIKSVTARAVYHLSANFGEYEVLFPAGRSFAVVAVEERAGRAVIDLEEQL